jgi:hypothetical protein
MFTRGTHFGARPAFSIAFSVRGLLPGTDNAGKTSKKLQIGLC